jgi:GNAT superfamily N-acetyltransferase
MSSEPHPILIREIALHDAEAAAGLSAELGYPAEVEEMEKRIAVLNSSNGRVVYVAETADKLLGWIEVHIAHHLSTGTHGEIAGLVVTADHRSSGIGRKLLAQAEQWVAHQGVATMVVRSRISREAAHRFYLREGYTRLKTSAVFSKQLTACET